MTTTSTTLDAELAAILGPISCPLTGNSPPQHAAIPAPLVDGSTAFISEAALARLFGCSARAIRSHVKDGWYTKTGDRAAPFERDACVTAYVTVLREKASRGVAVNDELKQQNVRKAKAAADLGELRAARERGDLIPAADVEHGWSLIVRDVQAAIRAVPARLANNLGHLTKADLATVKAELDLALERLADGAAAQAEEIDADD